MKTTAIIALAGTVAATAQSDLLIQREYILAQLDNIDNQIINMAEGDATAANATTNANATAATPTNATGNASGNATADAAAGGSNTGLIVGGVVGGLVLVGLGVWFYKKRQSNDKEGGNQDDLYAKFINTELSA